MKVVANPARAGLAWAREGARLFGARPLALSGLVGLYLLMVFVPSLVPFFGPALSGVLLPFATLALMLACREVAAGRVPTARVFGAVFQDGPRRALLFRLGLLYAGLSLLFAVGFALLGLDALQPAPPGAAPDATPDATPDVAPDAAPGVAPGATPGAAPGGDPTPEQLLLRFDTLLLQLLLLTPLFMAMWFAPVFVGWHLMAPGKAMFFSFFACWRNKWAILVFGAVAFGVAAVGSALLAFLVNLLGAGAAVANLMLAPWALAMTTWLYAAMYPMYRAVVDAPLQG